MRMICVANIIRQQGFNLIELMIVVAVIAVLAAIAIPNYQQYGERVRRADAQADLVELSQWVERYRINNNSFVLAAGDNLPFIQSPRDGNAVYVLGFESANQTAFVLQAVPANPGPQTRDDCGTLTLDHRGQRGADDPVDDCWR